MSDLLRLFGGTAGALLEVLARLLIALALGGIVALIYRRTRSEPASSFTATLVLLAILIAMVTQVIGDNVARAFSLVGALSIVRFRTVVRDTQDTAYVIFAVAVGMAVGASSVGVALAGIGVVAVAAFAMRVHSAPGEYLPFRLQVRVGLGHDINALLGSTLDTYLRARRLVAVTTTRQGVATEVSYRALLRNDDSAHKLVTVLNRIEGIQGVTLQTVDSDEDERGPG
ncbi:MAG: DUF4956 domain-containing protein [Alphaproteobacteria bacterium]